MIIPRSPGENNKGNNKKSQALSALLSASALGVFLEGCGGGGGDDAPPPTPTPTPPTPTPTPTPVPSVAVTGTTSYLAVASAEGFTGDEASNTVSYENAGAGGTGEGVTVDLQTPANNRGSFAEGDTYENIENIQGSAHADTLRGDNQANTLSGGAGDDTLAGGEGADTLTGGEGADTLTGGEGEDTLSGGADEDTLAGGEGADTLTGGAGEDTASYEFASEGVRVNLYETTVQVDFETNSYGFAANNNEAVGDILTEIEHITGSDHNDWLTGDEGDNFLQGGAGNDRLEASGEGDGAGRFNGGAGADTLIGGDYDDTVIYQDSDKGVRIDVSRTGAQIDFDGTHGFSANNNEAVGDILFSIEYVEGSDYNDWLTGEGTNSILQGGKGNDRLEGGAGADVFQFRAGDGTDTVVDDGGGYIVFLHGTNNDYDENTIYTLTRPDPSGEAVTHGEGWWWQHARHKFCQRPYYGFLFRTLDGTNTFDGGNSYTSRITDLVAPPRVGSQLGNRPSRGRLRLGDTQARQIRQEMLLALLELGSGTTPATVSEAWAAGDTLTNFNNVIGSEADDTLRGDNQDNILSGGAGADTLTGGEADTLTGGAGEDTASYEFASEGVRVDLSRTEGKSTLTERTALARTRTKRWATSSPRSSTSPTGLRG